MTEGWRIVVDLTYLDKDKCVKEFERICAQLKSGGYVGGGGAGHNYYMSKGPNPGPLTASEIVKLRALINDKD